MEKQQRNRRSRKQYNPTAYEENVVPRRPRMSDGPREDAIITGVLASKSMRDLRFGSIKVSGDPYSTAIGADSPYPLVTPKNPVVDADYLGVPNLNGNVLIAIDDPSNAKLMYVYDAAYTKILVNYLYCNRPGDVSQGVNHLLGQTVDKALAVLDAKMIRELAFVTDHWETNMTNIDMYNRLAPLIYFNAGQMNVISAIQAYNTCMAMKHHVMQMGYQREAPVLMSLYSLLAKKAFSEQVNLSGANLPGSYIDMDWFRTVSGVTAVPSRKANDKLDPLLTINATHWMPIVKEYRGWVSSDETGTLVFDSTTLVQSVTTSTYGTDSYDLQQISEKIQEMLAPSSILAWARKSAFGTGAISAQAYANDVMYLFQALQKLGSKLSEYMSVVNTLYQYLADTTGNVISKNGIVKLTNNNGFVASIDAEAPVVYNKLAADIFRAVTCGPADLYYDDHSSSWMFYSLWDRYYGIPGFEKMSGGAFLSFSVRKVPARESGETGIEQKYQFPVLFTATGDAQFVNRAGNIVTITRETLTGTQITNNLRFSRLQLGAYAVTTLNVPYYDWAKQALDPLAVSWLNFALLSVYGMAHQHRDDTIIVGDSTVDDYDMSDTILGNVDMEQVSTANAMVTFTRAKAPLMVQYIPGPTDGIGFR